MKTFKARIRTVPRLAKGTSAEFLEMKTKKHKEFFDIKVSNAENGSLLAWVQTTTHECIHMVLQIANTLFKYRVTGQSEHKFIKRIEESIAVNFYLLKERRKKK